MEHYFGVARESGLSDDEIGAVQSILGGSVPSSDRPERKWRMRDKFEIEQIVIIYSLMKRHHFVAAWIENYEKY